MPKFRGFSRPQVLAHRMLAIGYPENTLLSLRAAADEGCDWIELDVWNTRDGEFVSMHDATVDRTTDGTGAVPEMTLAEIKSLNAGKGYPFGFVPVPTVEEIFNELVTLRAGGQVVRGEMHLHNLEEPADLIALLRKHDLVDQCYMNLNLLATAEYIREDLAEPEPLLSLNAQDDSPELLEACQKYDVAYLCVPWRNLDAGMVDRIHEAGMFVHCYPVNTEEDMARMVEIGVDVIQTDYVPALKEVLEAKGFTL
ncbi:MAG: glycerophosphodiester phosphodiesterase [Promethearchaeota archaeon]